MGEIHLRLLQIDKLGSPEPVAVSHQGHGCVALAPAVALGGFNQLIDFGGRQVFAGAHAAKLAMPVREEIAVEQDGAPVAAGRGLGIKSMAQPVAQSDRCVGP